MPPPGFQGRRASFGFARLRVRARHLKLDLAGRIGRVGWAQPCGSERKSPVYASSWPISVHDADSSTSSECWARMRRGPVQGPALASRSRGYGGGRASHLELDVAGRIGRLGCSTMRREAETSLYALRRFSPRRGACPRARDAARGSSALARRAPPCSSTPHRGGRRRGARPAAAEAAGRTRAARTGSRRRRFPLVGVPQSRS